MKITLRGKWSFHPALRSEKGMKIGDWMADKVRNGMGSWVFVLLALSFLGFWMTTNFGGGFDPYPFIFLNLILSCVAALQGSILLIAARREDQISSELAKFTLEVDKKNLELTEEIAELSRKIHAMTDEIHSRVSAPKDTEGSLSSPTPPTN